LSPATAKRVVRHDPAVSPDCLREPSVRSQEESGIERNQADVLARRYFESAGSQSKVKEATSERFGKDVEPPFGNSSSKGSRVAPSHALCTSSTARLGERHAKDFGVCVPNVGEDIGFVSKTVSQKRTEAVFAKAHK
jgi:hypothetical protein